MIMYAIRSIALDILDKNVHGIIISLVNKHYYDGSRFVRARSEYSSEKQQVRGVGTGSQTKEVGAGTSCMSMRA